ANEPHQRCCRTIEAIVIEFGMNFAHQPVEVKQLLIAQAPYLSGQQLQLVVDGLSVERDVHQSPKLIGSHPHIFHQQEDNQRSESLPLSENRVRFGLVFLQSL